ncbi:hypothetical protein BDA96_01G078300 [Sorghum bicolor]|uniref:Uncharacterized protein n=2 Tax=Sorghum bicolor TaxID=4558 RepID=A0A921RX15_SORBI|nr:hypothetical protein BDA96_01G078300 [Sorghum bicolor]KXG37466.1 hypothetical protein SORBI_3001G075200 [Sorghum bicolor]
MRPSDSPTRTRRFRRPGSPLASPWCRQNFRCLLCRPSRSSRQGDRGGGRRDLGEAAAGYPIRRFLVRADAPVPSRRIPLPTITQGTRREWITVVCESIDERTLPYQGCCRRRKSITSCMDEGRRRGAVQLF